jgi:hypothetical protein
LQNIEEEDKEEEDENNVNAIVMRAIKRCEKNRSLQFE